MIIEIKGKRYIDPDWKTENGVGTIHMATDKPFAELVDDFYLEDGGEINQYNDNETLIGKWYVSGMCGIEVDETASERSAIIRYYVGQIAKDAQEAISEDVTDVSDAVLELCEMVAGMDSSVTEASETILVHTRAIERFESLYNALADRVARLENK